MKHIIRKQIKEKFITFKMRTFLLVLILIFGLQSWTKADDIRDFQLEGMSIGDSLLDYFSKKEIEKKQDI